MHNTSFYLGVDKEINEKIDFTGIFIIPLKLNQKNLEFNVL
jgi:hypothetical protein